MTFCYQIQLESCKQDLAEKNSLLSEASDALDSLEKQVESQKHIIKNYEEGASSQHQGSMFELGNVPKSKKISSMTRSPDVSRKPLMSPKEIVQLISLKYFLCPKHLN